MKPHSILLSVFSLLVANSVWAASAVVDVKLSPAGSFKAKTSDVKGYAVAKGDEVSAQNIAVDLKNLKTGVELRDKHNLKHLEVEKYQEAVLIVGKGKSGKGNGKIRIHGVEKDINGIYKVNGNELEAEFKLNLPDFKITNISYMGAGVEDEVTLHVVVPVKKGP